MKHFIILTSGQYDDYEVEQLYACDHPVDKKEWSDILHEFNNVQQKQHEAIYIKHGGNLGWGHIPEAHEEYIAWVEANHPWPAFVEKHGMVKLDHTELWSWGQP